MRSFFRTLFHYKIDPLKDYDSMMEQILQWVLLILITVGSIAVTIGIVEAVELGKPNRALLYVLFFSPFILVAVFQKRLKYKWGAAIVLFCLYIFAIHNITIYGFSGSGIPLFLAFSILVTVFYGLKVGLISIVAALIPMAVVGYMMIQGTLSPGVDLNHINTLPISWLTATSVLTLLGILMVLGYSFIQRNFFNMNRISKEQADELRRMNQKLKEEIRHKEKIQQNLEEAKEKAEESDRLKSAFLKNMSHEIRTPMNGIMGFANLLEDNQLESEKVEEYLEMIKKSGNRMLKLINNLVDIAMIESGETSIQYAETSLNPLVDMLYSLFKPEAERKGLDIRCEKGLEDYYDEIRTDSSKLKQILTNLISNALKYTNEGRISFGYSKEGEFVRFFVNDTGIGISPEVQQKIFERFRQAEMGATRRYEGAGLGLSISRAFVEMMGGKMWVESKPEEGSTFYFTLPWRTTYTEENSTRKTKKEEEKQLPGDIALLVVEDDETSYMLLREITDGSGINLLRAKNGKEAIEKVQDYPLINLILMDIKMPVMDGYETTREIKKIRPDIPVIAQTAYVSEKDREKAEKAGCDAYLSKPIDADKLMARIREAISE